MCTPLSAAFPSPTQDSRWGESGFLDLTAIPLWAAPCQGGYTVRRQPDHCLPPMLEGLVEWLALYVCALGSGLRCLGATRHNHRGYWCEMGVRCGRRPVGGERCWLLVGSSEERRTRVSEHRPAKSLPTLTGYPDGACAQSSKCPLQVNRAPRSMVGSGSGQPEIAEGTGTGISPQPRCAFRRWRSAWRVGSDRSGLRPACGVRRSGEYRSVGTHRGPDLTLVVLWDSECPQPQFELSRSAAVPRALRRVQWVRWLPASIDS